MYFCLIYWKAFSCSFRIGSPSGKSFCLYGSTCLPFGCVNCRDIESRVWPDERVRDYLNNKYVLLSLYVDDKTELSREQWYTSKYDSKIKKTLGKQNADFQITRFNNNAQPFYVILDPFSGKVIYKPWGYELDIENYLSHLSNGIKIFYDR